jgi:hypothetical protein
VERLENDYSHSDLVDPGPKNIVITCLNQRIQQPLRINASARSRTLFASFPKRCDEQPHTPRLSARIALLHEDERSEEVEAAVCCFRCESGVPLDINTAADRVPHAVH